jgi:hypothetical protein
MLLCWLVAMLASTSLGRQTNGDRFCQTESCTDDEDIAEDDRPRQIKGPLKSRSKGRWSTGKGLDRKGRVIQRKI